MHECANLHVCLSHVTCMNESCHTCEWVTSHVGTSHCTQIPKKASARKRESCHVREWVMSHMWLSHVKRKNESCHTDKGVMSQIWMRPGEASARHRNGTIQLISVHLRPQTAGSCSLQARPHSYVWHESIIYVTSYMWLTHPCVTYKQYEWDLQKPALIKKMAQFIPVDLR